MVVTLGSNNYSQNFAELIPVASIVWVKGVCARKNRLIAKEGMRRKKWRNALRGASRKPVNWNSTETTNL